MLRRMPVPKGRSKLAYGPCCNPTCPFAIDIRCKCGCGHERDPASVPTHHLFHPDCCTQVPMLAQAVRTDGRAAHRALIEEELVGD
jgi:hypothetical protein